MSPAYSSNPEDIFCWVGIIMYMPLNQSAEQRDEIRKTFDSYCQALQPLMDRHNAQIHWAKIELPSESKGSAARLDELRQGIRRRYPVRKFQEIRKALDPEGILANSLIERLFDEQGKLADSPASRG
jgi:L-galactono-1,4-lactone dehydrogenase